MRRHSLSVALLLSTAFLIGSYSRTNVSAGAPPPPTASGDLDQCANGGVGQAAVSCAGSAWQNGNLNQNQAHYNEGDSIPYRLRLDGLTTGTSSHTVTIEWDTTQNGKHALDYLTS